MENDINEMFIFIQSFLSNPVHFLFLGPFLFLWLPPSLLVLQSKYWSINLVSTSPKAWRFLQGTSCHLWEVPRLTTFSWTRREFITLFVFIIVFYGTDNVSEYNLAYSPHSKCMWGMCMIYIYIYLGYIVNPTKHCYGIEQCYVSLSLPPLSPWLLQTEMHSRIALNFLMLQNRLT